MSAFNRLFIEDVQEDLKQCLLSAKHQYNQYRDEQIVNSYNDDKALLVAEVTGMFILVGNRIITNFMLSLFLIKN